MRRPLFGLLLALVLYAGLRGLVLHTAFDSVSLTMYELYPMGTLPRILLAGGVEVPLHSYYDNAAGQLVTALLAVPFYAALGPTYLALKLVPFLLGLGTLLLIWALVRRHFGERAGLLGALLFALGPGTLVKYSLKASGNHYENVFFTLLAMGALWRVHTGGNRTARLWIAGYCMGLAIFVFLGAIIPVALLFASHLGLVGWRQFLRDLAHGAPAFVLGSLPLIVLNVGTHGRGASFLAAKFAGTGAGFDLGRVAARFVEFFVVHLPRSTTYPDFLGLPGHVAGGVFIVLLAVAWLAALPDATRATLALVRGAAGAPARPPIQLAACVLAPLVLYFPLTALAYGLSDLRVGGYLPPVQDGSYRYFIPALLFGNLLIAVVAGRWLSVQRLRTAGVLMASLALLTGVFDLGLVDFSFSRTGLGSRYDGYYMKQVARALLGKRQGLTEAEMVRQAESFPPLFRTRVYEGLGFYRLLEADALVAGPLEDVELSVVAAAWPPEHRAEAWRGAGTHLRSVLLDPARRASAIALLERWRSEDPIAVDHVLEGLASEWDVVLALGMQAHLARSLEVIRALPEPLRAGATRGLGIDAGRTLRREIAVEARWIWALWSALPADAQPELLRGLGIGLADGAEQPGFAGAADVVGGRDPTPLLLALRARLVEVNPNEAPVVLALVAARLPEAWRDAWRALPASTGL